MKGSGKAKGSEAVTGVDPTLKESVQKVATPARTRQMPGWAKADFDEIDAGTNGGDCGYRLMAIEYFTLHGKSIGEMTTAARAESMAKSLRVHVANEVEKNKKGLLALRATPGGAGPPAGGGGPPEGHRRVN